MLPWVNLAFRFIPNPNLENRAFSTFPELNAENVDVYPLQIDTFLSDNFSLRAAGMKVFGRLNLFAFKKSPLPESVYFGKEGWMFFAGDELKTFDGTLTLQKGAMDSLTTKLRFRQQYLKKQGIDYYMFIIPVKNNLYADKQTGALYALKRKNRTDYFMEHVKKELPEFNITYLKDELEQARMLEKETPLYWKTDNHWNRLGAFYGSQSILNRLKSDGHQINPLQRDRYKKDSAFGFYGNLSYYTGLKGVVKEWDYYMVNLDSFQARQVDNFTCKVPHFTFSWEYQRRFINRDTSLTRILFIRDSFGSFMVPYLAEGTGESLFIFDNWEYGLNKKWVERFKPKVVVHILLESYLENILTKTPYPEG